MTLHDMLLTLWAAPAGFLLGLFYFGSLWITVSRLPTLQKPIPLFIGGYLGRLLIAGLGFYLIMGGHWERSLIGLAGFLLARTLLVRRIRPKAAGLDCSGPYQSTGV